MNRVSEHGVWRVLCRVGLNTRNKRLALVARHRDPYERRLVGTSSGCDPTRRKAPAGASATERRWNRTIQAEGLLRPAGFEDRMCHRLTHLQWSDSVRAFCLLRPAGF